MLGNGADPLAMFAVAPVVPRTPGVTRYGVRIVASAREEA
jgi:hypothetical protein